MANEPVTYTFFVPFGSPAGYGVIIRSTDGANIPLNLGNNDYQAFLEWIAAGNTPPSGWTGPAN